MGCSVPVSVLRASETQLVGHLIREPVRAAAFRSWRAPKKPASIKSRNAPIKSGHPGRWSTGRIYRVRGCGQWPRYDSTRKRESQHSCDALAPLCLLSSAMTSSYTHSSPQSAPSPRRPYCIAELADRATHNLWDPSKGLKQWLKAADGFRKAGRAHYDAGDLEAAFVEFAKAATIILEKLPSHKEYFTLLTATQRHNLGLVSPQYIPSFSSFPTSMVGCPSLARCALGVLCPYHGLHACVNCH